jgi:23S rRNA (cytosine1962-C5)-methyltransferase
LPSFRPDYQLLDFGDGRRLERFGEIVLDRPCPAAEAVRPADPASWARADARFEGREAEKGQWTQRRELPARWAVAFDALRFELKRTDFGHVGLFPEQAENWRWIRSVSGDGSGFRVQGSVGDGSRRETADGQSLIPNPQFPSNVPESFERLKILNLFAYTGGSTLAAAAAGAEVVHVDAAKNIVAWARRNAQQSGLAHAPIHWIVEDAQKFVKRELRRGSRYDGLVLDPPTYGHGPRGEVWRLVKHLPRLLASCRELAADGRAFVLLTCHTPGYDVAALGDMMRDVLGHDGVVTGDHLILRSTAGRKLGSGVAVRWVRQ